MKRLVLLSLLVFSFALAADKPTIEEIIKEPSRFDGKVLSLTGKVAKFKSKTSRAGKKYFTFDLVEGRNYVSVFGFGVLNPEPKEGENVEATGVFAKVRNSANVVYKNELDVTAKGPESKNGVKIL